MLLWVADPDYRNGTWKYKRRNTVLGLWHSLKLGMWGHHLEECEKQQMWEEAQAKLESELKELVGVLNGCSDEVPF